MTRHIWIIERKDTWSDWKAVFAVPTREMARIRVEELIEDTLSKYRIRKYVRLEPGGKVVRATSSD